MARYVLGPNREQLFYDMVDIDRLVPEEHEVRRLWEFIDHLDMERIYKSYKAIEEEFGRQPIEPKVLFAVWLYGFMKGIISSEVLAELCRVHSEFRWICGGLKPCARTLRNFRDVNRAEFNGLLTDSITALVRGGAIKTGIVAQDGTTIRSRSSKKSFRKKEGIERVREAAKKRVKELSEMSEETAKEYSKRQLAAMKQKAERKLELAMSALEKLKEREEKATEKGKEIQVSVTEPESKFMECKEGMKAPAYNVQIVSSGDRYPAVLGIDVFEEAEDTSKLEVMAGDVLERLASISVINGYLTDKGYYSGFNARQMTELGIEWYCSVPENQLKEHKGTSEEGGSEGKHGKIDFKYDEGRDVYVCPEGKDLVRTCEKKKRKAKVSVYRCNECDGCQSREACTDSKYGRTINRSEYEEDMKELVERSSSADGLELLKTRGQTIEKINADIKERFKIRRMYVSGKSAVKGVLLMAGIAINALIWMKHVT